MGHILHLSLPIRTQEEEKDWLTWAKSLGTGVMCAANLRAFQLPSNWFEETRNVSRAADHLKRTGLGQRLKVADNCWELKVAASMPVPWRNQECFVKIIGSCPSHERLYGRHGKGDPWPMAMWPIQVLQGRSSTSLSAKWTKRRVRTNSSLVGFELMNYD